MVHNIVRLRLLVGDVIQKQEVMTPQQKARLDLFYCLKSLLTTLRPVLKFGLKIL